MINDPLVSILIPTYNREKFIEETLLCAINQTYENIEIIVVDNRSTDQTANIVKSYTIKNPKLKLYINENNIGPINNWKKCLELSNGDFIKFLFSDDKMTMDSVEKLLFPMLEDQQIGFSFSSVQMIDENGKFIEDAYIQKKTGNYPSDVFLYGNLSGALSLPVSPGCALFRRENVVKAMGRDWDNINIKCFNNGFGPDLFIFLIACVEYGRFHYIKEPLSYFRSHSESISILSQRIDLSLGRRCYRYPYSLLLKEKISLLLSRRIKTMLLIVTLFSRNYFENSKLNQYKKMVFPEKPFKNINLLDLKIWQYIIKRYFRLISLSVSKWFLN
jgi:glycosyltransferase involved in cell wall biosynthesis